MNVLNLMQPPRRGILSRKAGLFIVPGLIVVADQLFVDRQFGINLFLFLNLLALAVLYINRRHLTHRRGGLLMGGMLLASAPLMEAPTLRGALVSLVALAVLALMARRLTPSNPVRVPRILLRFLAKIPKSVFYRHRTIEQRNLKPASIRAFFDQATLWVVPLGFGLMFLMLFADANPLIEAVVKSLDIFAFLSDLDIWRVLFWLLVLAFVRVFIHPHVRRSRRAKPAKEASQEQLEYGLFGRAALVRALVLFNLLFAVQTLSDMAFLWGGVSLPEGMSYATYAHRGAYTLVLTALLAALFVLIAMRRHGPAEAAPLIRKLVFVWLAQNMLLCLSAILRLDLYIEAYSLTEFRVAAAIWMGLVMFGLVLVVLRILQNRSNEWLVSLCLGAVMVVFYVTAFLDMPVLVARFNLAHGSEMIGSTHRFDLDYFEASNGPSGLPVVDALIATIPETDVARRNEAYSVRFQLLTQQRQEDQSWQSWSLRQYRTGLYVAQSQ